MKIIAKIINDKYYTSPELAEYCVKKTEEIIGKENITEYLEPSAGNGVFIDFLNTNYKLYDIEPEDIRIQKQDYLTLELPYKTGRCVIGNPPFGVRNIMSVQFFKKSIQIADYIAFILPISQLNNNQQMYDFDLVYSEDLGEKVYSDKKLHCCFNIYRRPENEELNNKPISKLNDVKIIEYRRGGNTTIPNGYDYAMGGFGAGCVGKPTKVIGQYVRECYFYIDNQKLKDRILRILKITDWKSLSKGISNTYNLPQWKICKYLKEQIPEIN